MMARRTRGRNEARAGHESEARGGLTRERIIAAAVDLADEGPGTVPSMRRIASRLGVEAMSLYHHVAGKDAILDGMVDAVFAGIRRPVPGEGWREAMGARAHSARAALLAHPWAIPLLESRRAPGPETLGHHDAVLGCLRAAGFPLALAAHAYALIDSYVYGFVMQELALPFGSAEELGEVAGGILEAMPAGAYPHLAELMADHALRPGYAFGDEFPFGLELILEGLERALAGA